MEQYTGEDQKDCFTCTYRSPMFDLLTQDELKLMKGNRIPVVFKSGEIIRKQGTHMSHVISVTHGLAKLYREGEKDITTIMRIVKPTNFIGGPGIFSDHIHHFTVAALMTTSVCFIDLKVFKTILDNNKVFQEAFLNDFSNNVLSVYYRLIELTHKQVPGRMADTLLYLFDDVFDNHRIKPLLSKKDFADLSAMSRDSATKILREFQNDDIINFTKDEFVLLNPEALKRISRNG
jgi:CRP/FNR family transcriptional regulator